MKKILIVHASAGEGHKKAAFATYEGVRKLAGADVQVTLIDALDYTNKIFKYIYVMGYIFLVKYVPAIWGFIYYLLDTKFFFLLNQPIRILTNTLNSRKLVKFLKEEKFDVCISSHFLSTEVISRMKKEGKIDTTLITVVTDFQSHLFWETKQVDHYVVGAESTKQGLVKRGIDKDIINVYGIPIENRFSQDKNREDIIKKLGVGDHKYTILVMGGGFGVGPIEEIVEGLQNLDEDYQILVVCGHNKVLFERLTQIKDKFPKPTYAYGFCNNMNEIMFLADIMISKVGGMASSESLACQLPIISIAPIPGQEMRNATFLANSGVGFRIKQPKEAANLVSELLFNESKFNEIKSKIAKLARPKSAQTIAEFALKKLEK